MRKRHQDTIKLDGVTLKPNPKSKKGTYTCVIKAANGQTFTRGLGTADKTKAIQKALDLKDEINKDITEESGKRVQTFAKLFKMYEAHLVKIGTIERDIKPYRTTYNRLIGCRIDNITGDIHHTDRKSRELIPLLAADDMCNSITIDSWNTWFDWLKTQLSDSSLRGHLTRIAFMFEFAETKGISVPKINFRSRYKEVMSDEHKSRDFTEAEVAKLTEYFEQSDHQHNRYRFAVLIHTGLRLSEACEIRREFVDIDNMTIKIRRKKKKQSVLEVIPMNQTLKEELQCWLHMTKDIESEWLFCKPDGTRFSTHSSWLRKVCVKLEINAGEGQKIVAHSTRSRFVSRQIESGIPLPQIQLSVGHLNYDTTLRYSRLSPVKAGTDAAAVMQDLETKRLAVLAERKKLQEIEDAEYARVKAEIEQMMNDVE